MRLLRTAAAAASIALVGSAVSLGSAGAQTPGVGTASTVTKALSAQLGDGSLLGLTLLDDSGRSTIDPSVASPEAFSKLSILNVASTLVPALNQSLPLLESRSPGGQPSVSMSASSLPTPAALLSGSISPASLTSSLTDGVATSGLLTEVTNLGLLGGLVKADSLKSVLGTVGNPANAEATRSASVGPVTVLDLSSLLAGLGIPLGELPIGTVTELVDQLQAVVGTVPLGTLTDLVNGLLSQQSVLSALPLTDVVPGGVLTDLAAPTSGLPVVGGLLGGGLLGTGTGGIVPPIAGTTLVSELLPQITGLLNGLLGTALTTLDGLALLRLDGLDLGIVTKAAETLEGSNAGITGTIGTLSVGGIAIPGLDLGSAASAVTGLADQVTSQISSVLGTVDPGLANLVKVSVLDQAKSLTTSGGYTRSDAGIAGLTASIVPPAALTSIVSGITGGAGVGDIAGISLPALTGMPQLGGLLNLGGALSALSQGAVVKVADLQGAAQFTAAPGTVADAPGGTLPRTGGPAGLAILGVLFAALSLGILRWLHNPGARFTKP